MNPNELFIRVFDELEAKYTSNDQYDVLQCVRLLGQLCAGRTFSECRRPKVSAAQASKPDIELRLAAAVSHLRRT